MKAIGIVGSPRKSRVCVILTQFLTRTEFIN